MSASALRLTHPWSPAGVAAALSRVRRRGDGGPAVASLLGVEHEYRVLDGAGSRVDFRTLLPGLPVAGRALDPGDRHALRLPWGAALTADDAEAEVALPPLPGRPGTASRAAALAERARADLAGLLPATFRLEGYSTHLSVAMPDGLADAAARVYARTFAPALMLLLDGRAAPGLLVRPRPGRLELGGDYRAGDGLSAALVFATGSALVVARAVRNGRADGLPPLLDIAPEEAVDRYGWYVDRRAFGGDLYAEGRAARLPLAGGGSMTAGELLRAAWAVARRELRGRAGRDELALVDALVAGAIPLPCESTPVAAPATADLAFRAPEGRILDDLVRPGFTLRATLATWELAVFEIEGRRRAALSVPRAELGAFLAAAATGLLDSQVERFLARASAGDLLASRDAALTGARLWDGVGDPRALLAAEPDGSGSGRRTALQLAGTAARTAWAAGRLAGVDLDDFGDDGDGGRPGKRAARPRRPDQRDPRQQPQQQPQAPAQAPAGAAPAASSLPIIPIAAGAGVVGVAALLLISGALGGRPASTPTPAPTTVAAVSAIPVVTAAPTAAAPATPAPSAPVATASPSPSPSPSPTATPLTAARIAGVFTGEGGSYSITITPACPSGPCDGTADVLSPPFAANAPRAAISMPFTGTAGVYGGTGSGPVPFCRTASGETVTATPTYTLADIHATAAEIVNGDWVATAIDGTISFGDTSVTAADGTTCSSNPAPQPISLTALTGEGPTPAATEPPLADARIDGSYKAPQGTVAIPIFASCASGPCDAGTMVTISYDFDKTKRTFYMPLVRGAKGYGGSGTAKALRCSNGALANVTYRWSGIVPLEQKLINGEWVATRLRGSVARLKFASYQGRLGCRGDTETFPTEFVREGEIAPSVKPPLANGRFEGTYTGSVGEAAVYAFTALPSCDTGPCGGSISYENYLLATDKVATTVPLTFSGGAYGGRSTTSLRCTASERVDVTQVFSGLKATKLVRIGGEWIATELTGKIRRLGARGATCDVADESATIVLTRK